MFLGQVCFIQGKPKFWATFFHGKRYVFILKKKSFAAFWAIFSQTHLITLLSFFKST
jgi:hypothetical protein